jgi:hypothetical protein
MLMLSCQIVSSRRVRTWNRFRPRVTGVAVLVVVDQLQKNGKKSKLIENKIINSLRFDRIIIINEGKSCSFLLKKQILLILLY